MKKLYLSLGLFCLLFPALRSQDAEKEEIKNVIMKAYVEGIHNGGSLDEVQAGFHPGFVLLGLSQNQLTSLPIYNWVESIRQRRKENPGPPQVRTTCKFPLIDVTGNAAAVKLELFRAEKLIFTDYLFLYKFDEGWRIVNKIYYRH